jgi:hypothetical protein
MIARLIAVLLLCAGTLAAQEPTSLPIRPALRLYGGMLNPDDPFQVTMAVGAAGGLRVSRFGIFLQELRQSQNGNSGSDLTSAGRTFVGVALEFEGLRGGLQERQGLLQLGGGRLKRSRFETTWYVQAGIALRYRVVPGLALLGDIEDLAAPLPAEPARCEPLATGGELCTGAVVKQVQHNFGFLVALEFVP